MSEEHERMDAVENERLTSVLHQLTTENERLRVANERLAENARLRKAENERLAENERRADARANMIVDPSRLSYYWRGVEEAKMKDAERRRLWRERADAAEAKRADDRAKRGGTP